MTVSAAEKFTSVGFSGSAWDGYNNLEYGDSGEATGDITTYNQTTGTLLFSIPNYITDLPVGSEFVRIQFEWQDKFDLAGQLFPSRRFWLTGGTEINGGTVQESYSPYPVSGTQAAWGLPGTPQSIFTGLKDGNIKLNYKQVAGGPFTVGTGYMKEVTSTLTYKLADTLRASTLVFLP